MGRRGRKRQLEVETEYSQQLKAGVGTVVSGGTGVLRAQGDVHPYGWR